MDDQRFYKTDKTGGGQVDVIHPTTTVAGEAAAYLKQVYAMLAASLLVAVAAGTVGMGLPFAHEHPILIIVVNLITFFALLKFQNMPLLFLFTGTSGLTLGPVLAMYVAAGMSGIVGQAALMTGITFGGLSLYALTTHRDFSMMGGMLFAGLIVILVGGIINLFVASSAFSFALAAMGTLIFSGYILFETQQYKMQPWAVPPVVAAASMYLNIVNLFLSLLRILGIFGGED